MLLASSSSSFKYGSLTSSSLVHRTQIILERMEYLFAHNETTTTNVEEEGGASTSSPILPPVRPTLECYQIVLRLWLHRQSHDMLFATRMQEIYDRMDYQYDRESFSLLLEAWCHSREGGMSGALRKASSLLLKRMEGVKKDHLPSKILSLLPQQADYENVLRVLSTQSSYASAERANRVLMKMSHLYKQMSDGSDEEDDHKDVPIFLD